MNFSILTSCQRIGSKGTFSSIGIGPSLEFAATRLLMPAGDFKLNVDFVCSPRHSEIVLRLFH